MSLEWMYAHVPELCVRGQEIYKSEGSVAGEFALFWAPCGDGAIIEGSRQELLDMLAATTRMLQDAPS